MLQFEWPRTWSTESRESVRAALQKSIRSAMSGSTNKQIRGNVIVDLPNLGSTPPEIILSDIRKLSVEHTALMVKFRYSGDFSVTLRGLQINLDTIGSADEGDVSLDLPLFCPLEMTLHDFVIDGMASIELLQECDRGPAAQPPPPQAAAAAAAAADDDGAGRGDWRAEALGGRPPHLSGASGPAGSGAALASRESSVRLATPTRPLVPAGYGILLGAGGRRAMRPPDAADAARRAAPARRAASRDTLAEPGGSAETKSVGGSSGGPAGDGERCSLGDLLSGKASVRRRTLKAQLFGNPLKNMRVSSNFAVILGANNKVEGTVKMLIEPAIRRMMTEGITINL